jgi:predicted transcriptional regulator
MKTLRRDRLKIYGDILSAIYFEAGSNKIVMTKIQVRVNLPYDRLILFIKELVGLGFVQDETSLRLTGKGKQYLREYRKTLNFLKRMGLSYNK